MPLRLSAFFVCLSTYLFSNFCLAQNLVLNPSFEETVPDTINEITHLHGVKGWRAPDSHRTIYLNPTFCKEKPELCFGFNKARTGNACAGLMIFSRTSRTATYSMLQGFLSKPLQKGKIYQVEFYLKLADSSSIYMKKFDVSLSPSTAKKYTLPISASPKPWITKLRGSFLKDKENWLHVNFQYIALGGEKFITFGCTGRTNSINNVEYDLADQDFWKKNNIINPNLRTAKYRLEAFYFIDDVSVTETSLTEENGRFSSIYFNSNSISISESDLQRLENLVKLRLSNILNFKISIEGFADKQGEEKDNAALSENRAKVVADYLIQNGVSPERIKIQGFGETQAAQQNSDNDRRVDVFLNLQ
ncbi:OmpA family protein [Chondrinema litorale]|uniref:OmpA family protein n=1 Tax=Chondrinema litorale TaxID=2994555 RepID=UPI0025436DBB|nr:OmpA family protein [Chondrinema litorale]UZR97048.1 OmpA family protein [Chondrinema litorale]